MSGEQTRRPRPARATRAGAAPKVGDQEAGQGPVPIELLRLFYGRRGTKRSARTLPVELRTADGRVCRGVTVNVSRGGALLDLNDGRLFPPGDTLSLFGCVALARDWLGGTFEVHFERGGVTTPAQLVRAVATPKEGTLPWLGVRFLPVLTEESTRRLGLEHGGDEA